MAHTGNEAALTGTGAYDCVVVGAGLGGLCAAFELSRAGAKTLLLEGHNLPGGFATSFVRGRFEFEPSLHELPDMRSMSEATGVVRYLLDDAGLEVGFASVPEAYRLILTDDGVDLRMPFGIEACIAEVERAVPGSRPSVSAYFELCREVQDGFGYLNAHARSPNVLKLLRDHGDFVRTASATAAEVARAVGVPSRAHDILFAYWCYLGVPAETLSFPIWASLLYSYLSSGAVIPTMRSHELASAFDAAIRRHGGEICYNSRVDRVLVEDGAAWGVTTASGETIRAAEVVCNASPTTVFESLVHPASERPAAALRAVNARKHGFSVVVVYLGLDADREALGLADYSYFIAPHMDTRLLYDSLYDLDSDQVMQASICLNSAIPDCSPPGTAIVSITAGIRPEAWSCVEAKDYFRIKSLLADKLIGQFEAATGARLRGHIEELEVATPVTFARYTGAWDGVVYGYEPAPWDSILPRAISLDRERYLAGLDFCGGFSYRCHGYGSSILSGKAAAERTLARLGARGGR